MSTKLNVKGMHCESCKVLVQMELEENGFEGKVRDIFLNENETGVVILNTDDMEESRKAKQLINAMENYEVSDLE